MKSTPKTLTVIVSIAFAFLIMYAALNGVFLSNKSYAHIQDPLQQSEHAAIMAYLRSPVGAPNTLNFLTPAEQSHMSDVKWLFDLAFIIQLLCFGVMLGIAAVFSYNKMWNSLEEVFARSLRAAGWTLLGVGALLGLSALLDFTKFWALFHVFLFPQGNWAFASDSILITLYPAEFFAAFAQRVLLHIMLFGVGMVLCGTVLLRFRSAEAYFTKRRKQ